VSTNPPSQFGGIYDEQLFQTHLAQTAARLPGPDYYVVLRWIHEILQPKTYVEIGVREGVSLRQALPDTLCLGVDPAPALIGDLHPNERIFAMTSDEFFQCNDLSQALDAPSFGLAFIDGLHLWEQALQDFIHLERYAGPESTIVIHDCLPLDDVTSRRVRTTAFYSGDVWKLVVCLKELRPDLRMATVRTSPTGLSIVNRLDRTSGVLESRRDEYMERYACLTYSDFERCAEGMPQTIGNDRDEIGFWLTGQHEAISGDLKTHTPTTS